MNVLRRLLPIVALSTFLAACGGTESDTGNLAEDTSAARGGKKGTGGGGTTTPPPPTSGAYVVAPNAAYGGYTTVKFYPGSAMDAQLAISVQCYQGGTLVWQGSTWELHGAISLGVPGYAFLGDHYEWTEGPFTIAGGAACTAYGWASGSAIASAPFTVGAQ